MIYIDKVVKAIAKYCVPKNSFVTKIRNVFFEEWIIRWTNSFIAVKYKCKYNKDTWLINWKVIEKLEIKKPVVWLYLEKEEWKAYLNNKDMDIILNIEEEKGKKLDWSKIENLNFTYQYNLDIYELENICKIFKANWDNSVKMYHHKEDNTLKFESLDNNLEIIIRVNNK